MVVRRLSGSLENCGVKEGECLAIIFLNGEATLKLPLAQMLYKAVDPSAIRVDEGVLGLMDKYDFLVFELSTYRSAQKTMI